MPHLDHSESDRDMSDAHPSIEGGAAERAITARSFGPKTVLMSGIPGDHIADYGFYHDSNDSDVEVHGQVKPLPAPTRAGAVPQNHGNNTFQVEADRPESAGPFQDASGNGFSRSDPASVKPEAAETNANDTESKSIKAEQSADSDDDASIHYGNGADEEGSPIDVSQLSTSNQVTLPPETYATNDAYLSPGCKHVDQAPQEVRDLLERWWAVNGRKVPSWAGWPPPGILHQAKSGVARSWYSRDGEPLKPAMYQLTGVLDPGKKPSLPVKRFIVVTGPESGSSIVTYSFGSGHVRGVGGSWYSKWLGLDGLGPHGFEPLPTVWKGTLDKAAMKQYAPTQIMPLMFNKMKEGRALNSNVRGMPVASNTAHQKPSNTLSTLDKPKAPSNPTSATGPSINKSLRPRESINMPAKFHSDAVAKTTRSNYPHVLNSKRKRDDVEEPDGATILNKFLRPATESRSTPMRPQPSQIEAHLKNNVVLLFYGKSGGAPRIRLLGQCDTVQKLFAHAIAGDVFDGAGGSTAGSRVLSLTFGCGQNKMRNLVENDEQDFEDLMQALKESNCWMAEGGEVLGSLTVEVRPK